jgi:hypothetical protein
MTQMHMHTAMCRCQRRQAWGVITRCRWRHCWARGLSLTPPSVLPQMEESGKPSVQRDRPRRTPHVAVRSSARRWRLGPHGRRIPTMCSPPSWEAPRRKRTARSSAQAPPEIDCQMPSPSQMPVGRSQSRCTLMEPGSVHQGCAHCRPARLPCRPPPSLDAPSPRSLSMHRPLPPAWRRQS